MPARGARPPQFLHRRIDIDAVAVLIFVSVLLRLPLRWVLMFHPLQPLVSTLLGMTQCDPIFHE